MAEQVASTIHDIENRARSVEATSHETRDLTTEQREIVEDPSERVDRISGEAGSD